MSYTAFMTLPRLRNVLVLSAVLMLAGCQTGRPNPGNTSTSSVPRTGTGTSVITNFDMEPISFSLTGIAEGMRIATRSLPANLGISQILAMNRNGQTCPATLTAEQTSALREKYKAASQQSYHAIKTESGKTTGVLEINVLPNLMGYTSAQNAETDLKICEKSVWQVTDVSADLIVFARYRTLVGDAPSEGTVSTFFSTIRIK